MPQVSVVIPTYNRKKQLENVLKALEEQTFSFEDFEVVVVSDGSQDGTNEYLETLETPLNLVPVLQENQGVAAARNRGFKDSRGEIVLFIDDDVVPTPQLICEHLRIHRSTEDDVVVIGPMLSPPDFQLSPWTQWEQAMLYKQYNAMIEGQWEPTARQFFTGNASLAKRLLDAVGGFDPSFRRAEDVELAYRLADIGVRFLFSEKAIGYHYVERSFSSWITTPYEYGRNDVIFDSDKGQSWLLSTVFEEYKNRHIFIRALNQICMDRAIFNRSSITSLRIIAEAGYKLRLTSLSRFAYSAIFNLRYYQGIADGLNGRQNFFVRLHEHQKKDVSN
jgi:GT2 family glycosyltransferase